MSISNLFEIPGTEANTAPKAIPMTEHILQNEVVPLGVFFDLRKSKDAYIATPIALLIEVSWLAEPGILFCDGNVVAVGKAYDQSIPFSTRQTRDPTMNTSTVTPNELRPALGGTLKVCFTELIDLYFEAVKRSVAVPAETAMKLRSKLAHTFDDSHGISQEMRKCFFTPVANEAEMDDVIKRHRGG